MPELEKVSTQQDRDFLKDFVLRKSNSHCLNTVNRQIPWQGSSSRQIMRMSQRHNAVGVSNGL